MPFYIVKEMKAKNPDENPNILEYSAIGEFMKAAVVTKPEGEGVPLHMHANEEQWTYMIDGQMHFMLDDEERIVGPGDVVHIPRYVHHRSRAINGAATFFTVKSPAGEGKMQEDYAAVDDEATAKAEQRYEAALKK